jgi:hypothetical protein
MTVRYSSGHFSQTESSGGSAASRFRLRFEAHQAVFPLVVAVSERSIESPAALKLASFVPAQAEKQHCSRKGHAYNGGAHTSANVSGIDHTTYYAGARERLSVPGPLQPDPGRTRNRIVQRVRGETHLAARRQQERRHDDVGDKLRGGGQRPPRRCAATMPCVVEMWQATARGSARRYAAKVCG